MDIRPDSLSGDSIPMAMFVGFLSGQVGRTVVNRTDMTGRYAIELRWSPDFPPAIPGAPDQQPESGGASIFTALQEQLGLRLVASRGMVEVLVVDHVEKPTGN
jgi:uncharacterized protein (TIGR03435 family)